MVGCQGGWGGGASRGKGWWSLGFRGRVSRFHSIDRLPKLWLLHFIVYRMEFDKTKCPWNSDQIWTQNSARGSGGRGQMGRGSRGWVQGVVSFDRLLAKTLTASFSQ